MSQEHTFVLVKKNSYSIKRIWAVIKIRIEIDWL